MKNLKSISAWAPPAAIAVTTILVAVWACWESAPAQEPADAGGAAFPLTGPNAYDTLKTSRFSIEVGPVYFAHDLHADLRDTHGAAIACVRCHHTLKKEPGPPPTACSSCHRGQDQPWEPGKPPYT